jgi:hypothetical protein
VVAVGLLAVNVLPRQPDGSSVGGTASATPSASPSPTPSQFADFPPMTRTFVSPTNGFSFKYNRGAAPATGLWDPVNDNQAQDGFDVVETGFSAYFMAASTPIPDGVSIDAWVDKYVTPVAAGGCGVPRSKQATITIDGQPGRVAACQATGPNLVPTEGHLIEATVVDGGRLYLFRMGHLRTDGRAIFDAWAATIRLHPEDAAPSASPST